MNHPKTWGCKEYLYINYICTKNYLTNGPELNYMNLHVAWSCKEYLYKELYDKYTTIEQHELFQNIELQ